MRNSPRLLIWAGVAVLAVSAWLFHQSLSLTANGLGADGTVVRLAQGTPLSGDPRDNPVARLMQKNTGAGKYRADAAYYAVIRFRTESGEEFEFRTHGNNRPLYRLGERVPVIYDPEMPETAQVYSFGVLWAAPLATALIGLGLVGFGLHRSKTRTRQALQTCQREDR